jgi:hypothetical protein
MSLMPLLVFILLLFLYLFSGYGILTLLGLRLKTAFTIPLSLLLGVAVVSFVPFLLQLLYIPLTTVSVFGSLILACLLLNTHNLLLLVRKGLPTSFLTRKPIHFRIRLYEIPYLLILGFLVFVSVWRCYYLPPTSRDALSGPEAIAEFAVREHTMVNSFFNIDLWSTNNQFKSPYLVSLQMIYKMAGFPFGQLWLSVVFVSFTVLLYHILKEKVHPVIAGFLLLLFTMAPEMYAYTFMILYDYSNMVFFFLSLYFLFDYFKNRIPANFYCAALLMGIATYIRSETLALAALFIPAILVMQFREKFRYGKMAWMIAIYMTPALLGYYLPTQLYIKHYLPVHYDIGSLVNDHPSDLRPLFQRYSDIFTHLLTGEFAVRLWGYITYLFAFLFLAEGILLRRFNKEARNWIYGIVAIYLGLGVLGWLLPMMNLNETTKRALFKMLPLMVLYMASNEWLLRLSLWISRWENRSSASRVSPGKGKLQQAPARSPSLAGKGTSLPHGKDGSKRKHRK